MSKKKPQPIPEHFVHPDDVKNPQPSRTKKQCVTPGCTLPRFRKSRYCEACLDCKEHQENNLTALDRRVARKQLGLTKGMILPRCPGKSHKEVRALEMRGEPEHGAKNHEPCAKCSCRNYAGQGTTHVGYGYCSEHEDKFGEQRSLAMAEAHRNLVMSPNPGVYKDLDAYSRHILGKMQEGEERLSVMDDLTILRGLIQEVISRGQGCDDHGDQLMEYVGKDAVRRPISDKTRIELMAKLLPKVTQFLTVEAKLRESESIDVAQFEVWFGRFFSALQDLGRALDNHEITTGSELVERFRDAMRELGDPRGMKGRKQ